jgi:two-component sensor histidine kinase
MTALVSRPIIQSRILSQPGITLEPAAPVMRLEEQLLIRELTHRINNEFASIIGVISLTAARSCNPEVKAVLNGVREFVYHYASVARALQPPQYVARINAAAYLHELCYSMSRSRLDYMNINLVLAAPPLQMQSERCRRLGMIVHELITNAARHAFGGRAGEIRIELSCSGSFIECSVLDNGSAPESIRRGDGLTIINGLVEGLGGRFEQQFGAEGSKSILVIPE